MNKYLIGAIVIVLVVIGFFVWHRPAVAPNSTPTATPTPTASPTLTPTPTTTVSVKPTPSKTPVPTATPKKTPTPTPVPTATPTPTPVPTPSQTPTPTPTPSLTPTPTPTPTATPKPEPTISSVWPTPPATVSSGSQFRIYGSNFIIGGVVQIQTITVGQLSWTPQTATNVQDEGTIITTMEVSSPGTYDVSITSLDGTVSTLSQAVIVTQ